MRAFKGRCWGRYMGLRWKKLDNKALHDLYIFPNIIKVINSRNLRWAGHVKA